MKNVIICNLVLSLLIGKIIKITKNSPKYVQIKHSLMSILLWTNGQTGQRFCPAAEGKKNNVKSSVNKLSVNMLTIHIVIE